ncbi:hypothetical protein IWGMT90018_27200 [Mycobacterium kiyosense]|nr:hypothetical protein IWGMT90018_27200 [Mycobacterium kiyosense]
MGSAPPDAQLDLLEQVAVSRPRIEGVLDIEVPLGTQSIDGVDWRSSTLSLSPGVSKGAPVPAGRTAATHSRLLYDVLGTVYDWLGFDVVEDSVFRDLLIARIVEPTSKVDAARVLADLGADTVSYRTVQRHLAKVNTGNYREQIAAECFTHASIGAGWSLLLYDVTTLYFEAENEDDLRKVGYSNYPEVVIMPIPVPAWRFSCRSTEVSGAVRAA